MSLVSAKLSEAFNASVVRQQARSRQKKWEFYESVFAPRRGERVLDVGVSVLDDLPNENYFLRRYPYPEQLTAVGVDDVERLTARYPKVTFVRADGRSLPFRDASFDVVHSNAVVEHVGSRPEQERFIAELVRVGRSGFVTTPNRWFPIETHSRLPLVHWLPQGIVHGLAHALRIQNLGYWLLGARSFRRLFPPTVEVELRRTRVLAWPLTLVIVFRCEKSSGAERHPSAERARTFKS